VMAALRRLPAPLAVALLAALAHLGTLRGGFHYDDEHTVVQNRAALRDPATAARCFADASVFSATGKRNAMYRPVTVASLVADANLWEWEGEFPSPAGWHLTNLLLHAATAAALLLLLRRVFRDLGHDGPAWERGPPAAAAAAALGAGWFAVHPALSEVVHYVSSRSESLAALFFVLALLAHRAAADEGREARGRALLHGASAAAALLSLGSKETGALLPAVAVALDLAARRPGDARPLAARFASAVVRALPLVAAAGAWLLVRRATLGAAAVDLSVYPAAGAGEDPFKGGTRSLASHLLTQSRVVAACALLLVLPFDLAPDHGVRVAAVLDAPTLAGLLGLAAVAAAAGIAAARGRRLAPLALAWAACAAAPSVLVPLNVVMNEHRLYLPATGLALLAGAGLLAAARASAARWGPAAPALALAPALAALLATSSARAADWADGERLWTRAVATSPSSWRNWMHLGTVRFHAVEEAVRDAEALEARGEPLAGPIYARAAAALDETLALFREAWIRYPGAFETRLNMGFAHLVRGNLHHRGAHPDAIPERPDDFLEAARWFTLAEEASPGSFRAKYNRGTALARAGALDRARAEFLEMAEADPGRTTMYAYPLADIERRRGDADAALRWLDRVLEVAPGDAATVALKRAEVLGTARRFPEADAEVTRALGILGPEDAMPGVVKARLLAAEGDPAKRPLASAVWKRARELGHRPGPKDRDLVRWMAEGRNGGR
jgi:tetratricopeptide (TPR) repeat protein